MLSDYLTNCDPSGERNGKSYDEDIIIDRDSRRKGREERPARRRSVSRSTRGYTTRDEIDIAEEAEYYNQRAAERSYMGEAYNGAVKDWAIVDVPPGTKRVEMEGIGGAREEITWQRYNGVRRSKFIAEQETYSEVEEPRGMDRGRRFQSQKPKQEAMWTEITKDLVVKEAIDGMGYDYEETEFFYYVMEYLRYVSLLFVSPLRSLLSSFAFVFHPILYQAQPNPSTQSLITNTLKGRCPPPRRNLRRSTPRSSRPYSRNGTRASSS